MKRKSLNTYFYFLNDNFCLYWFCTVYLIFQTMKNNPQQWLNILEINFWQETISFKNRFNVLSPQLAGMTKAGMLSARSQAIATFALCGFSNPASIGKLEPILKKNLPRYKNRLLYIKKYCKKTVQYFSKIVTCHWSLTKFRQNIVFVENYMKIYIVPKSKIM